MGVLFEGIKEFSLVEVIMGGKSIERPSVSLSEQMEQDLVLSKASFTVIVFVLCRAPNK